MEKRELVIIGAGPAGLSAAIYGKRAGLDTLVLEKGRPGGQGLITSKIENYPGILDGTGSGLADAFRTHAEHFKAEFRTASVQKLEVRDGEKIITLKDGSEIAAGAVIVASGASFASCLRRANNTAQTAASASTTASSENSTIYCTMRTPV